MVIDSTYSEWDLILMKNFVCKIYNHVTGVLVVYVILYAWYNIIEQNIVKRVITGDCLTRLLGKENTYMSCNAYFNASA